MRSAVRRLMIVLALNIAAGLALFAFMYWNERMAPPHWAETAVHRVYNAVFGFTLPMQAGLESLRVRRPGADAHHVSVQVRFVAYFLTPLLLTTLGLGLLYHRRRQAERKARRPGATISRRTFLISTSDALLLGGGVALSGYSTWYEPWALTLREYEVPIAGLPPAMDGYRIVQISDTHYGPFIPIEHIRNAIRIANARKPDFVVLTGDYVHRAQNAIDRAVSIFSELTPRHGIAAVLGNHDHWEGADAVRKAFGDLSIPMLDNARVFLGADGQRADARPGEGVCLGGVGDLWEDLVLVPRALRAVDPDVPRVLLSHNPDVAERRDHDERIDLMLSGHTHGGQISVPYKGTIMIPSSYGKKYAGGLCKGPRFPVIVSRGVGMAVMPYRFRVPPEVVQVTLRKQRA